MKVKCEDCKFKYEDKCRRFPAIYLGLTLTGPMIDYPTTYDSNWCGEFVEKILTLEEHFQKFCKINYIDYNRAKIHFKDDIKNYKVNPSIFTLSGMDWTYQMGSHNFCSDLHTKWQKYCLKYKLEELKEE